ncbi:hypothetical protein FNV43_RR18312 [Rhamnella rubrinervis]|uniref:U1-type domain-containing protein n=1 Tax=Rhamnella rubrinervis TaxID=2594499 RepID=A0A8K0GVL5_9ROSA|nr:hypothetical protein FNV43_RR18312 [Rhamnella rubrinervis]
MDYSSYAQSNQQDHQQYNQQFQHPEQQQLHAYDHSSQSYYSYNQHPHPSYDQYSYYHSSQDYTNYYTPQQLQQEPTSIHPPGVPIPPEPANSAEPTNAHMQNRQNAYYPHGVVENQQQLVPGLDSAVTGGFNPAAVAALSQLNQFAGNMDVAQSAMHLPIGQTPYRGGGRRGNRSFRGGGRGHFSYHGPRPDGSAPFHGRGRGQGGGRHFTSYGAASTNPNPASVLAEGIAALVHLPSSSVPGQISLPVPTQVPPAPIWQPPRMAWCELCRVDCNTPEILEQHKNGKKHKKNLQVHEELQKLKIVTGQQNAQAPNSVLKPDVGQSEKVEGFVGKQPLSEKLTSETATNDNGIETELQNDGVGSSEASAEPEKKAMDKFPAKGRGFKRKMRGGRGCESQVVFDSHMTGKKHLSNLKRFHGHHVLYGEAGLQALYPPSSFTAPSSSFAPQFQQGVTDPQVILAQLLMTYVLSQTRVSGIAPPPGHAPTLTPAPAATATSFGTQNQSDLHIQGPQLIPEEGSQVAVLTESKGQLQPVVAQSEPRPAENTDTPIENATSEFAGKEVPICLKNSVAAPGENSGVSAEATLPVAQCKVVYSDAVVQPKEESKNESGS